MWHIQSKVQEKEMLGHFEAVEEVEEKKKRRIHWLGCSWGLPEKSCS
jgi:hypothetical protein